MLEWLAQAIPEVNPTSLTTQGMYAGEQFAGMDGSNVMKSCSL
jgi:hypothetical protein